MIFAGEMRPHAPRGVRHLFPTPATDDQFIRVTDLREGDSNRRPRRWCATPTAIDLLPPFAIRSDLDDDAASSSPSTPRDR